MISKSLMVDDKDPIILHWQGYGCWWLGGNIRSRDISSHSIDIIISEYSAFMTTRVKGLLSKHWLERLVYQSLVLFILPKHSYYVVVCRLLQYDQCIYFLWKCNIKHVAFSHFETSNDHWVYSPLCPAFGKWFPYLLLCAYWRQI